MAHTNTGRMQDKERKMRKDKRWMTSILKEAAKPQPPMPWERGARRAAMIDRRKTVVTAKVASA